jgi:methionine salvage enolase-phosphatase E1
VKNGFLSEPLPASEDIDDDIRIKTVVGYLLLQMDRDRKLTGLKAIQGKIWSNGYADGLLKGQ